MGYFSARYYDNTSAMWLGVDPLWEKYAGMNPYNYCAGNPVMMVDPDGRDEFNIKETGEIERVPTNCNYHSYNIIGAKNKEKIHIADFTFNENGLVQFDEVAFVSTDGKNVSA